MLMVKTRLGVSAIEGIGLFAAEPIAKGTVTWRFVSAFDRLFTAAEIDALPEPACSELRRYVYLNCQSGRFVYCLDNARFMNHTTDPNTRGVHEPGAIEGHDIAVRDIAAGEEITCDYREFDGTAAEKLGG